MGTILRPVALGVFKNVSDNNITVDVGSTSFKYTDRCFGGISDFHIKSDSSFEMATWKPCVHPKAKWKFVQNSDGGKWVSTITQDNLIAHLCMDLPKGLVSTFTRSGAAAGADQAIPGQMMMVSLFVLAATNRSRAPYIP
jgi:hypothetical protein